LCGFRRGVRGITDLQTRAGPDTTTNVSAYNDTFGPQVKTLLTFVDACDPYAPGLAGDEAWCGPTLSLLKDRPFDRLVLLGASGDEYRAAETAEAARTRHPGLVVETVPVADVIWTGWAALVAHLERLAIQWQGTEVTASVGAGSPLARAAWMAVASTGAVPLRLLDVEPKRYVTDVTRVVEIRLGRPPGGPFLREPAVAYRAEPSGLAGDPTGRPRGTASAPDLEAALRRLGLCGEDPAYRKAVETAAAVAPHNVPVLIQGETGTGKGMLARLIHALSGRAAAPFVAVNCAALPEQLVESILFGHKKGSFTGAGADQAGKFELAHGGTLFLDEVGELPLVLQPKLLKVLEDGVVEPLGAARGRPVDVRIVAATNRDLPAAVARREFREDLYYRLSFARVTMPALRERRGDIHHLALQVLARQNAALRNPRRLAPAALRRLEQHPWPGNVRDLENVIGRSLLLTSKPVLEASDLLMDAAPVPSPEPALPDVRAGFSLDAYLDKTRRALIQRALEIAHGKQAGAARLLGVTPQAIHKFLRDA
jgi:transcriptional regulator with AAA-type ATPase domain